MAVRSIPLFLLLSTLACRSVMAHPELDLKSTTDLISYWGYPVESHRVITEDGYILTMHRIPHGKTQGPSNTSRPVFYLQHPLTGSSSDWVLNKPSQSLAFMLADQGYDVWLGNVRGNTYSRNHITMKPSQRKFWDFSFQEHGKYDFPAMINHVLNKTGEQQLYYVGHSQGTIMAFTGLTENTELKSKIKLFFALAPVTRLRNVSWNIKKLASTKDTIYFFYNFFGIYEVLPASRFKKFAGSLMCNWIPYICKSISNVLNSQYGEGSKNLNETRLPIYFYHRPAGTSLKNLMHYFQEVKSGRFEKYDYGVLGNFKRYGTWSAPEYDISKIDVPTVIISGSIDGLAPPRDVKWTREQLPNVIKFVEIKDYNHNDLLLAITAAKEINSRIIRITKRLEIKELS